MNTYRIKLLLTVVFFAFVAFNVTCTGKNSEKVELKSENEKVSNDQVDSQFEGGKIYITEKEGFAYSADLSEDQILKIIVLQENLKQPSDHILGGKEILDGYINEKKLVYIKAGEKIEIKRGNLLGPGMGTTIKFIYKKRTYYSYDGVLLSTDDVDSIRKIYKEKPFNEQ